MTDILSRIPSGHVLDWLEGLSDACDPSPWLPILDVRGHVAASSFIMTGLGDRRGEDLDLMRETRGPVPDRYWDLVAGARTWLNNLITQARDRKTDADRFAKRTGQ